MYSTKSEKRDALALEPIPHSFLGGLTVGEHQEWPKADQTLRAIENAPLS